MNNNDNYKTIFDMVSPAGSDGDFIKDIVARAERDSIAENNNSMVRTQRPMYVMSAALVAVIALAVAVVTVFGGGGEDAVKSTLDGGADNQSDGRDGEIEDNVVSAQNTPDVGAIAEGGFPYAGGATETVYAPDISNPDNPYNFTLAANTFEGLDVRVTDVWGDETVMIMQIEAENKDKYFNSLDEFRECYPGELRGWRVGLFREDGYGNSVSYNFALSDSSVMFVRDGKLYWNIAALTTDGERLPGIKSELILQNVDTESVLGESSLSAFVPHAIVNTVIAKITANYTPSESYSAIYPADETVRQIVISDCSLTVYYPSEPLTRTGAGGRNSVCRLKYAEEPVSGAGLYSEELNYVVSHVGIGDLYYTQYVFGNDMNVSARNVEAVIVDGVEYPLAW